MRRWPWWFTLLLCASCHEPRRTLGLLPVPGDALCVTSGELLSLSNTMLRVRVPSMRAELRYVTQQAAELRFRYVGPTTAMYALSSGQERRQIGLKLRASDPCNLLYVMWRLDPEPSLVVSTKRNPKEHTSTDCGNKGYQNVVAREAVPVPEVLPGSTHSLRAELSGDELRIEADDRLVWVGDATQRADDLDGPIGVRSDNGIFELELRAGESLRGWTPRHCTAHAASMEP